MSEPLDDQYLSWLYAQVASVRQRDRSRSYWDLLRQLYVTEFVWFVPNDDNRVEDGRDLRLEFFEKKRIDERDVDWAHLPCSMLEMLIALSRRIAFEAEGKPADWFWHMLTNVELNGFTDAAPGTYDEIDGVLSRIIWRTYDPDGHGGLFPLHDSREDQRKVELLYQLSAYLYERL
jgi:hypothetical protein